MVIPPQALIPHNALAASLIPSKHFFFEKTNQSKVSSDRTRTLLDL